MIEYKFGPWLPDETDHRNPGLEVCENAIPGPGGYMPAFGVGDAIADVAEPVISARVFERSDGTKVTVCATASDLHVIVAGVETASGLTLTLTGHVTFERFGGSIWATERDTGTWVLDDIEADTAFLAATNSIPSARTMSRIGEFLFMGDLVDIDTNEAPYRVRWSPFNNPGADWDADIATQSGSVDMPEDFGPMVAISGWNFGMLFQRRGISRIQYTGGTSVFAKIIVDRERGCASTASIVMVGDRTYFLSDDGFFMTDGGPSQSISRGRIWSWFLENVGQSYFDLVKGAVDWPNRCVVWTVPDENGIIRGLVYFNWETSNWSYVSQAVDCVFSGAKDGLTLEQVSALYPDLDTMPISLDSPIFKSIGRYFGTFVNGELRLMDGIGMESVFETGEFQISPGKRNFVTEVYPIITNVDENTTVQLIGRNLQNDAFSSTPNTPVGPLGFAPFGFDSRFFRVRVKVAENSEWSNAFGFQIEAMVSGV